MPKARKMTHLSIEETSGVDHPAHLREGWLVVKSADADALPNALNIVTKEQGMTNEEMREELDKARKRMAEMEEEMASYKAKAKKAEAEDDEEDEEALMKAAPEAVVALFEKAKAAEAEALTKAAEAEAELRAERDAKADAEAIEKARSWGNLSVDAEQVGPTLRRLADVEPELAKSVEGLLDAVNAQAESADIFAEIGKSAPASETTTGDSFSRIQAMAKAAVESGRSATMEQAVAEIATENPDLYVNMLTEKGA